MTWHRAQRQPSWAWSSLQVHAKAQALNIWEKSDRRARNCKAIGKVLEGKRHLSSPETSAPPSALPTPTPGVGDPWLPLRETPRGRGQAAAGSSSHSLCSSGADTRARPSPGPPSPALILLQLFSWAHSWVLSHSHVWGPRLLPTTLKPDRSL